MSSNDPVDTCAHAIITLGRGYRDGDEDERSDIDRDDYYRKYGEQRRALLNADADHLAEAIKRLAASGNALFVADAMRRLAHAQTMAETMGPGPWGSA
jgi:hypothetical protein